MFYFTCNHGLSLSQDVQLKTEDFKRRFSNNLTVVKRLTTAQDN